jgi:Sec-independent protein translocase protein TatA
MMKGLGQGVQSFKQGMNEPLTEEEQQDGGQEETTEKAEEKTARTETKQSDTTATSAGK